MKMTPISLEPKPAKRATTRAASGEATFVPGAPPATHDLPAMLGEPPATAGEMAAPLRLLRRSTDPGLSADRSAQSRRGVEGVDRQRLARRDSAAFRTVVNILGKWNLDAEEKSALLGIPKRTFYQWCKYVEDGQLREPASRDVLERMSYILGVWKAAAILLPGEAAAIAFIGTANNADTFGGLSPLQRMQRGSVTDLAATRQWFDGWRGG